MVTFALFTLSGIGIVTITMAKRFEEKRKKPFFLLSAISKGDERVRELHHQAVHWYSIGKEKIAFFVKKQLPMRSRNSFNKLVTFLEENAEKYFGNIRDSRLLKKSDGISEFFKNMSAVEKGSGEINEVYEETPSITPFISLTPLKPIRKTSPRRRVKIVVKEDN